MKKKPSGTSDESEDWKIPEIRKISGIPKTRRDPETRGSREVGEVGGNSENRGKASYVKKN